MINSSQRRKSSIVHIGNVPIGGDYPIRIQSMTNTSTLDTESSIEQCIRIIESGGEYVRLTAQGIREAENLKNIKAGLHAMGYHTPLIADIHFNPKAAKVAACIVEKVRINPGNFSNPIKTSKIFEYTDEEYRQEMEKIQKQFVSFLHICKQHHTAIRIGVNHGSLSNRIMSRYGNTPQGMVESCMEFLRICMLEQFTDIVISVKASNTSIMVKTVRLLVEQMDSENMHFPIHLGVTEAGEGEDGRIKSAIGIGTLLLEGIGDTIRISLTENPEAEIPVAQQLIKHVETQAARYRTFHLSNADDSIARAATHNAQPIVLSDRSQTNDYSLDADLSLDYIYTGNLVINGISLFPLSLSELTDETILHLKTYPQTIILLHAADNNIYEQQACITALHNKSVTNTIVIWNTYDEIDPEIFQIKAAIDCSSFFIDRLADGLMLSNRNLAISQQIIDSCAFGILQATGQRISKTEYISCPGCGRTQFDLQTAVKKVKAATAHLKGLKIAVIGCIVNGLGEMAEADYGYVGAGAGKVSLYRGKECVLKDIQEELAINELLRLIK